MSQGLPPIDEEKQLNTINKLTNLIYDFFRDSKFKRQLLVYTFVLVVLNKGMLEAGIAKFYPGFRLPAFYAPAYYVILLLLLLRTVHLRYKEIHVERRASTQKTASDDSPVQGLFSFEARHAQMFRNLQRNEEIQQYREAILNSQFRFGVLTGVSGSGKTSLLHAGLKPELVERKVACYILTLSNRPINESIKDGFPVLRGETGLESEVRFAAILKAAQSASGVQACIIILDQFEQLYTHHPQAEKKQFLSELKEIYRNNRQAKILVSVRSDFLNHLHEWQRELGYSLDANHNYWTLEKFTPAQTAEIFRFIAEKANIKYIDTTFLEKIAKEQLASKDDGRISPVDIQIVAFVLKNQYKDEKAFTERFFNKMDGIGGILKRYLESQLYTPTLENKDNAALKLLVAMIDLKRNVRAGQLSEKEIRERVMPDKIPQQTLTLEWLERIRLIHITSTNPTTYQLAHEMLIEPIVDLYRKADLATNKANVLLERRLETWTTNERKRKYLLALGEYLFIGRHLCQLDWGKNEEQKREFLQRSLSKLRLIFLSGASLVLLVFAFYFVPTTTWYKMNYEIYGIMAGKLKSGNYLHNTANYWSEMWKLPLSKSVNLVENLDSATAGDALLNLTGSLKEDSIGDPKEIADFLSQVDRALPRYEKEIAVRNLALALAGEDLSRSMDLLDSLHNRNSAIVYATIAIDLAEHDLDSALRIIQIKIPESDQSNRKYAFTNILEQIADSRIKVPDFKWPLLIEYTRKCIIAPSWRIGELAEKMASVDPTVAGMLFDMAARSAEGESGVRRISQQIEVARWKGTTDSSGLNALYGRLLDSAEARSETSVYILFFKVAQTIPISYTQLHKRAWNLTLAKIPNEPQQFRTIDTFQVIQAIFDQDPNEAKLVEARLFAHRVVRDTVMAKCAVREHPDSIWDIIATYYGSYFQPSALTNLILYFGQSAAESDRRLTKRLMDSAISHRREHPLQFSITDDGMDRLQPDNRNYLIDRFLRSFENKNPPVGYLQDEWESFQSLFCWADILKKGYNPAEMNYEEKDYYHSPDSIWERVFRFIKNKDVWPMFLGNRFRPLLAEAIRQHKSEYVRQLLDRLIIGEDDSKILLIRAYEEVGKFGAAYDLIPLTDEFAISKFRLYSELLLKYSRAEKGPPTTTETISNHWERVNY
jgi:hypothetical protein